MTLLSAVGTLLAAALAYVAYRLLTASNPYQDIPLVERESWLLGNDSERERGSDRQAGAKLLDYAKQFGADVFLLPEPMG